MRVCFFLCENPMGFFMIFACDHCDRTVFWGFWVLLPLTRDKLLLSGRPALSPTGSDSACALPSLPGVWNQKTWQSKESYGKADNINNQPYQPSHSPGNWQCSNIPLKWGISVYPIENIPPLGRVYSWLYHITISFLNHFRCFGLEEILISGYKYLPKGLQWLKVRSSFFFLPPGIFV